MLHSLVSIILLRHAVQLTQLLAALHALERLDLLVLQLTVLVQVGLTELEIRVVLHPYSVYSLLQSLLLLGLLRQGLLQLRLRLSVYIPQVVVVGIGHPTKGDLLLVD